MATLVDSFLAELDDLSIDGNHDEEVHKEAIDAQAAILNYNNLDHVSKLQKNQHFHDTMKKVDDAMLSDPICSSKGEDDPEYQLIIDCSTLVVDIDHEITIIHNFIRNKYRAKFPELESLVLHPVDYSLLVKQIGNEMDLTLVDLKRLLPSSTIMSVCVTASTTRRKPLLEEELQKTIDACDRVFAFDKAKKHVLDFLESRMKCIAPNLSAVVGSTIAAKLISIGGGLAALTRIPACNVQILGAKKKNLTGLSTTTQLIHTSFVFQSKIVQSVPPSLQLKACREVANKCALAARVDYGRNDLSTQIGETFQKEIEKKIEKWQEHPPSRQTKPLLIPNIDYKKKRGGRRLRKMKERYALTDRQKLENRMKFGTQEESSLGDGLGRGYGMLSQVGSGKLQISMYKRKMVAKVAKKVEKQYGNIGATSGLSSSLAFTPLQGIELINPQAQASMLESGIQNTYFS